MSGRNNRIVRNRERSSEFSWNSKALKMVGSVVIVAFVVAAVVMAVLKIKNHKPVQLADSNGDISYEYFILSTETGIGVIDKKGNQILEPKYTSIDIPNPAKDVFIVYEEEKSQVLNTKGEPIFSGFEKVEAVKSSADLGETERQVLRYQKGELYGLLDLSGNAVTEAIYSEISSLDYRPGRILVKKDEKYGVFDFQGNVVIDVKYDQISADGYCSNQGSYEKTGYIVAKKLSDGMQFGYIDYKGKIVLDAKYESVERALEYEDENAYLIAMQKGKKGVFKNKKKLIDLNFQNITYSALSKVFIVNKNGKYGFYRLNGKVILKPEYGSYSIAGNYISVKQEEETKLFDINGNLINTNSYTKMIETENPAYFIAEDEEGNHSIISKDVKIDEKYVQVSYAFDHYFIVTDHTEKVGVINAITGEMEINPKYDFILLIDGTHSLQAIDGMNNLVDIYSQDLKKTVTMKDGIVEHIKEEYSIVYSENDMKYINSKGEVVENTEVYPNKKLHTIQKDGKWGFCDENGNVVVTCEYDIATELNQYGFAGIKKAGKWGVIDETGNVIVEPTYELDTYYFPQFIGKYRLIESEIVYCEEV